MLSPADLVPSERVDAVVAGDEIGLALAEELRAARAVRQSATRRFRCSYRPGGCAIRARWGRVSTCASPSTRVGLVPLRSHSVARRLPSGHDEALDATFALEVNRWNGREEPRLVLRSALSPAPGPIAFAGRPQDDAAAMFAEFEAFAAPAAPAEGPPRAASGGPVRDRRGRGLLGTLGALVASGERVLVACACETTRREALRGRIGGLAICSWDALERDAGIADAFSNVVALDPPPSAALDSLLRSPPQGRATHLAWGEPELRFSLDVLDDEQRLRSDLALLYRALRDASSAVADAARAARSPGRAGRLLRVLHELGVVDVDVPAMRISVPDVQNRAEVHRSETLPRAARPRSGAPAMADPHDRAGGLTTESSPRPAVTSRSPVDAVDRANGAAPTHVGELTPTAERLLSDLFAIVEEHADEAALPVDRDRVTAAFLFAYGHHADQRRKSGEEFIVHPVGVAKICAGMRLDTETLCAALLHDTVEDTSAQLAEVERALRRGGRIARRRRHEARRRSPSPRATRRRPRTTAR